MIKYKKAILFSVIVFFIAFSCYWIATNTNYYKNKQALKIRDKKINELNNIKRHYIYEGVYTFDQPLVENSFKTDNFGNVVKKEKCINNCNYEISFTSNKLIILNNNKRIKEELSFKNNCIITELSDSLCIYKFTVCKWILYNTKSKKTTNDIIKENNNKILSVNLHVPKNETPFFVSSTPFKSIETSINPPDGFLHKNKYISHSIFIYLESIKHKYNTVFVPSYASNAIYEKYIYDPKTYIVE